MLGTGKAKSDDSNDGGDDGKEEEEGGDEAEEEDDDSSDMMTRMTRMTVTTGLLCVGHCSKGCKSVASQKAQQPLGCCEGCETEGLSHKPTVASVHAVTSPGPHMPSPPPSPWLSMRKPALGSASEKGRVPAYPPTHASPRRRACPEPPALLQEAFTNRSWPQFISPEPRSPFN